LGDAPQNLAAIPQGIRPGVKPADDLTAVVIGAGIAGLTAAHELAERRFQVWVVEPTQDVNRFGVESMAIGGMARTQYVAACEGAAPEETSQTTGQTPGSTMRGTASLIPLATFSEADFEKDNGTYRLGPRATRYLSYLSANEQISIVGEVDPNSGARSSPFRVFADAITNTTHLKPVHAPFTDTYYASQPSNDLIVLVCRSREALVKTKQQGLTPEGQYYLRRFARNLPPGIEVNVEFSAITSDDRRLVANNLAALQEILSGHPLNVSLDGRLPSNTVLVRIDPRPVELPVQKLEKPFKDRELTSDGEAALTAFVASLRSGDIVEIHVTKVHAPPAPTAPSVAVRRIREALKRWSIAAILRVRDESDRWIDQEVLVMRQVAFQNDAEYVIPGEHGFRFFPAYYRHLRHSMARIPVFETTQTSEAALTDAVSGHSVIDNLVNTPVQALAGGGINPIAFPRTPSVSPIALFLQLRDLLFERNYDIRDIHQFLLRIFRYKATGSVRRQAEFERLSWWEYLRGYDPNCGTYRYQYSDSFIKDIGDAPRILAAFDAQWGDARSDGNTFVQLLLSHFLENRAVDQVLNGPTTEAWFDHWEKYLRRFMKVTFVPAAVERLVEDEDPLTQDVRVKPSLTFVGDPNDPVDWRDFDDLEEKIKKGEIKYFVLATDALAAEQLTSTLRSPTGAARELQGFVTRIRPYPFANEAPLPRKGDRYGDAEWDRFQTLTGIQFYFSNPTSIFNGHVYFMDAEWALSSINQEQFWRRTPVERGAPYQSILSADIGRFNHAWKQTQTAPNVDAALQSLAKNVWSQVTTSLAKYWELQKGDGTAHDRIRLEPRWFHIDKNIEITRVAVGVGLTYANNAPYLIPMAGDWDNRPADNPWDPGGARRREPLPRPNDSLWHAPWGGYRVHWGQWVFAGTYLKHFTRMTTMEAANESGRHAVNAILDHLTWSKVSGRVPGEGDDSAGRYRSGGYYTGGNPLDPHAAYVPTPHGDYCHIWDPEKNELADFVPLREFDDWLCENGLPHVCDLLGIEVLPSLMSRLPTAHELGWPSFGDILRAVTPPFTPSGTRDGWWRR
jgi:hypothetical protein